MAKTVTVNLVDDIDGTCAEETVTFSFDGSSYEIDLGIDNARKLRSELMAWAQAGRPAPAPAPEGDPEDQRLGRDGIEANAVRGWARLHGFEVGERGRVPLRLVEAYESANQQHGLARARAELDRSRMLAPA